MITIIIENLFGKTLVVRETGITLLSILQNNYIDWMHSCGGKGRCTTCKFRVMRGADNLGALTAAEVSYRSRKQLSMDERLACQALVEGDITLRIPGDTKLPHISYSD